MRRPSERGGSSVESPPSAPNVRKVCDVGTLIGGSIIVLSKHAHVDFPLANLRQYKTDDIVQVIAALYTALDLLNAL